MSWKSMGQEGFECDHPGCSDRFANSQYCALYQDGRVMAFCAEHSRLLLREGVNLVSISEANLHRQSASSPKTLDPNFVRRLKGTS